MQGDETNGTGLAGRLRGGISPEALREVWPHLLVAVLAGVLSGGFAAWAYNGGLFYPLSHTFGLWIVTVALLSARRSWRIVVPTPCPMRAQSTGVLRPSVSKGVRSADVEQGV